MMVRKTSPVGIDKRIDYLQTALHPILDAAWGTGADTSLTIYGRAERKYHDDGITLEAYSNGNEYIPLMNSEGNKVFFVPDNRAKHIGSNRYSVPLNIVVLLDLAKVYPSIAHRADEEAHVTFNNALRKYVKGNSILEQITGIDEIRRALRDIFKGAVKFGDLHPYHIFMVRIDARYENNC